VRRASESRFSSARRTSRRVGVPVAAVALTLAGSVGGHADAATGSANAAPAIPASLQIIPSALADQANSLIVSTVLEWTAHQLPSGAFADPVSDRQSGYGVAMIGQAMVQTGIALAQPDLVQDGLRAELSEVSRPNDGVFETLALAQAYSWNHAQLASYPAWQAIEGQVGAYLSDRLSIAEACTGPCPLLRAPYANKKLVAALADVELDAAAVVAPAAASPAAPPPGAQPLIAKLLRQALRNTSHNASETGPGLAFTHAGLLSDPTENPLAYDVLSTMMLGHLLEAEGSAAPSGLAAAFTRGAEALIGLMAPDGDVAYIGRGQGQVWVSAAAVDALAIAADESADPIWRGRYLDAAGLELDRLQTLYPPANGWGMPLAPRLAGVSDPSYLGIDHYANTVEYNGLALWALEDAELNLRQTPVAPTELIAADGPGVFVDPSQARFAAVRHGELWWAIHAGDTNGDARYDFGLIAAERDDGGGGFSAVLPYRPLTATKTSGGPLLIVGGRSWVPEGTRIAASPGGTVKVTGGWSPRPGDRPTVETGTRWSFTPAGTDGVLLSFRARPRRTYRFEIWFDAQAGVHASANGVTVTSPSGSQVSYELNLPVTLRFLPTVYHSAYAADLASATLTVHTGRRATVVRYLTVF
jgi:hypothetical protein